jgi:hypothetical protein
MKQMGKRAEFAFEDFAEDIMDGQIATNPTSGPAKAPYFDEKEIGNPEVGYVCWLDVMGTRSTMLWSVKMAANFVMKLHVATLEEAPSFQEIELFPVIDGIYLCTANKTQMLNLLKNVFIRLVTGFIAQTDPFYRFIVRGALAYGPVVKGKSLKQGSDILHSSENESYCDRMLLGMPLSQTYEAARTAAPFGLYVHESARAFAPKGTDVICFIHWQWWKYSGGTSTNKQFIDKLTNKLKCHFDWCEQHATSILYEPDAIKRHKTLAKEYFEWDDHQVRKQVP